MIDPKVYTLLKVYECGSFVGAATALSLTQPAVSHHIKLLEEELGVKLFERVQGHIILSKQGEIVVNYAKKMLGVYENLRRELAADLTGIAQLTVGITHTAESNPMAESLARYGAEHQNVNIKLITSNIKNLYSMLTNYEIDLAVVEGKIPDPKIRYLPLDTDYLVLAVSPDHPFAGRSMVSLQELMRERMILRLPESGTRNLFVAHLESNNMSIDDFNVILEVDNIATIKDLIRRDFGVSILPRSVCLDELKKKKIAVLPVENLSMIREVNLAYPADFTQIELLHDIINAYHETVRLYK